MKKKLTTFFLILVLTTILVINSCKKDYPKDIPKWLKVKIREYKKGGCKCPCYYSSGCLIISERVNGQGEKIYEFYGPWQNPMMSEFYDYSGNIICNRTGNSIPINDSCGTIHLDDYVFVRDIWEESK